jgi:hypothetical protein
MERGFNINENEQTNKKSIREQTQPGLASKQRTVYAHAELVVLPRREMKETKLTAQILWNT